MSFILSSCLDAKFVSVLVLNLTSGARRTNTLDVFHCIVCTAHYEVHRQYCTSMGSGRWYLQFCEQGMTILRESNCCCILQFQRKYAQIIVFAIAFIVTVESFSFNCTGHDKLSNISLKLVFSSL